MNAVESMRNVLREVAPADLTPEHHRVLVEGHTAWLDAANAQAAERLQRALGTDGYGHGSPDPRPPRGVLQALAEPLGPGSNDRADHAAADRRCFEIAPVTFTMQTDPVSSPAPAGAHIEWLRFARARASDRTLQAAVAAGQHGPHVYPPALLGNTAGASIGASLAVPPHGIQLLRIRVDLHLHEKDYWIDPPLYTKPADPTSFMYVLFPEPASILAYADVAAGATVHGPTGSASAAEPVAHTLHTAAGPSITDTMTSGSLSFVVDLVLTPSAVTSTHTVFVDLTARAVAIPSEPPDEPSAPPQSAPFALVDIRESDEGPLVTRTGARFMARATAFLCGVLELTDEPPRRTPVPRPV